jgi:peroxiredoxin Q/BCP
MKLTHLLTITLLVFPMALFSNDALDVGQPAPALSVTTHTGETLDMGALYEKGPVLVYFYPKADTPGCTKQACNLRDNFSALQEAGVEVVGVSSDNVDDQRAFQEKYELPFTLVADNEKKLGKAFGTGTFMGIGFRRQSFLIVDGKIAWRDLKASPSTQTADALAALKAVQAEE